MISHCLYNLLVCDYFLPNCAAYTAAVCWGNLGVHDFVRWWPKETWDMGLTFRTPPPTIRQSAVFIFVNPGELGVATHQILGWVSWCLH